MRHAHVWNGQRTLRVSLGTAGSASAWQQHTQLEEMTGSCPGDVIAGNKHIRARAVLLTALLFVELMCL